jgi:hypothetical protein
MFKTIMIVWAAGLVIGFGVIAGSQALTALCFVLFAIAAAVACVLLYFLPTTNARRSHHPNAQAIFVINLFLGWTLLGWVGALAWSLTEVRGRNPAVS